MTKTINLAVLAGDGIGPEIVNQAVLLLENIEKQNRFSDNVKFIFRHADVGGIAYANHGHPLPQSTIDTCAQADAILFGAVGDWKYDILERHLRPEQAILGLRKHFNLFANFRPAKLYDALAHTSTLKYEVVSGLDLLIIRELNGDVYFGEPKGTRIVERGQFAGAIEGFDTMKYSIPEVERIAHVAFSAANKRSKKLCSVDKANVLETSQIWRDAVISIAKQYPEVTLTHMYVDNAAMQLVKAPKEFDVILTGNLFGDILSDQASMLCGSIGMLASASMNKEGFGLYEPSHGSAPDIANKNIANPLATILSSSMMLRFSFGLGDIADAIEMAIEKTLASGLRTADIFNNLTGEILVGTDAMGQAVIDNI
jgi:3-isopropylmalate dehydrogenase